MKQESIKGEEHRISQVVLALKSTTFNPTASVLLNIESKRWLHCFQWYTRTATSHGIHRLTECSS